MSEWMRVLGYGAFFGAAMLLFDAMTDRERLAKWPNLFATAFSSFVVGMLHVFGRRVLNGGIAILFLGVLLAAFGTGFVIRRARKSTKTAEKMP
jgi:hypothetical protein